MSRYMGKERHKSSIRKYIKMMSAFKKYSDKMLEQKQEEIKIEDVKGN